MFSISLKMIFRSWARNKIYFVISMLSLIIGLTCSVLLIGFVANEYNIAHVVKGGGQWYLLQEQNVYYSNEEVMANHTLNGGRAVAILRSFPEVEDICVCHDDHKQIKKNSGETIPYAAIYAVTPNFADLFQPERDFTGSFGGSCYPLFCPEKFRTRKYFRRDVVVSGL